MTSKDRSGATVVETISARTPRAMEEFNRRLDEGVTFSPGDNVIHLDFSKIYDKAQAGERHWGDLFDDLARSPFPSTLEHPLCQAFLHTQFRHVKTFFILGSLVPHLLFSGISQIKSKDQLIFADYFQWCSVCTVGSCLATSAPRVTTPSPASGGSCSTPPSPAAGTRPPPPSWGWSPCAGSSSPSDSAPGSAGSSSTLPSTPSGSYLPYPLTGLASFQHYTVCKLISVSLQ